MVKTEELSALVDAPASEEQITRWQDLSAATLLGSLGGEHTRINGELEAWAKQSKEGPFRELHWYWMGSNLLHAGADEQARDSLRNALDCGASDGSVCNEHSVEIAVRELLAETHLARKQIDAGIEQYDGLHDWGSARTIALR